MLDIQAQTVVDAHVLIGDPDESEECNQVSTPSGIEQLKARDEQEECSHIVAETVFTG